MLCNSGLSPSASSRFIFRGLQPRSRSPYDFVNPRAVLISAAHAPVPPAPGWPSDQLGLFDCLHHQTLLGRAAQGRWKV